MDASDQATEIRAEVRIVTTGAAMTMHLFTIGHSNRAPGDFLALLQEFTVEVVVDIRSLPRSRTFPHFDQENLKGLLRRADMEYVWLLSLGGLRRRIKGADSPNTGLTSQGFRNYADHMTTDEFRGGVHELLQIAGKSTTACMCAEAVYWRCHRRLLSDYLVAHGVEVQHILGPRSVRPHTMTVGSQVTKDGLVIYPDQQTSGTQSSTPVVKELP